MNSGIYKHKFKPDNIQDLNIYRSINITLAEFVNSKLNIFQ